MNSETKAVTMQREMPNNKQHLTSYQGWGSYAKTPTDHLLFPPTVTPSRALLAPGLVACGCCNTPDSCDLGALPVFVKNSG